MNEPLKIIENTLMLHHQKIDQSTDKIHELDKKVDSIHTELRKQGHDIKQILSKLEIINHHDERISNLEEEAKKRKNNNKIILKIIIFIAKLWPLFVILIICSYAFNLKIEVENPNLAHFIMAVIQSKL